MIYLGAALVVFKVTQLTRHWVEAPLWAVWCYATAMSALVIWLAGGHPGWCVAVAAGAGLIHRIDTLLMAGADAAKVSVLRNTRRR
jgi:hypothetical protein